jgi:hypothetical protein
MELKPLFSRNDDINKTSFLNWNIKSNDEIFNFSYIAEGYLTSAIKLIETCINDNSRKDADLLILPILHNANHGIELYCKALLGAIYKKFDQNKNYPETHNIKQLFTTFLAEIKKYFDHGHYKEFKDRNEVLSFYISELFGTNGKAHPDDFDFTRYSKRVKKAKNTSLKHFYVGLLENCTLDLENLFDLFEAVLQNLKTTFNYFYYYIGD